MGVEINGSTGTTEEAQPQDGEDLKQSGFDTALNEDTPEDKTGVEQKNDVPVGGEDEAVHGKADTDDGDTEGAAKGQQEDVSGQAQKHDAAPPEQTKQPETPMAPPQAPPPETLEEYLMKDDGYKALSEEYSDVMPLILKPVEAIENAINQIMARQAQLAEQLNLVMPLHQERAQNALVGQIKTIHGDFDIDNPYDGKLAEWIQEFPEGSADQRYVREVLAGSNVDDIVRLITRFKRETGYQGTSEGGNSGTSAPQGTAGNVIDPAIKKKLQAQAPVKGKAAPVSLSSLTGGSKHQGFEAGLQE